MNYWLIGGFCATVLVIAAALGYALIERPGIAWGKRVILRRRLLMPDTKEERKGFAR